MSKLAFRYNIRSELPPNPESPAALGARFVSTLDTLTGIDPSAFHNWEIMTYPAAASVSLEAARPRMTSIIEKAVYRSDLREPLPEYGYKASALVIDRDKSRNISFDINAGGKSKGDTALQTGEWNVFSAPGDRDLSAV